MKPNKDLIRKYLDGDCTAEEEKEALRILTADESSHLLDEIANEAWEEPVDEKEPIAVNPDHLYQNIRKEAGLDTYSSSKNYTIKPWVYAACFAFVVMFTLYFALQKPEQFNTLPPQEMVVKTMPPGMKSTILLNDGSKVILNSGSTISYPTSFTDSSRVITLQGEAYFEVAKDINRPFSVLANNTRTTALGTSFNINARGKLCKVSLATGKVLVAPNANDKTPTEETYMLEPGEALEVNNSTRNIRKTVFDPNTDLLWKDGILYFKETPVKQIIETLELWYDVKFEMRGKHDLSMKYTGRFENASLTHVMDNMSFALDLQYFIQGKKVVLVRQTN